MQKEGQDSLSWETEDWLVLPWHWEEVNINILIKYSWPSQYWRKQSQQTYWLLRFEQNSNIFLISQYYTCIDFSIKFFEKFIIIMTTFRCRTKSFFFSSKWGKKLFFFCWDYSDNGHIVFVRLTRWMEITWMFWPFPNSVYWEAGYPVAPGARFLSLRSITVTPQTSQADRTGASPGEKTVRSSSISSCKRKKTEIWCSRTM